jgi:hypothetical protein
MLCAIMLALNLSAINFNVIMLSIVKPLCLLSRCQPWENHLVTTLTSMIKNKLEYLLLLYNQHQYQTSNVCSVTRKLHIILPFFLVKVAQKSKIFTPKLHLKGQKSTSNYF